MKRYGLICLILLSLPACGLRPLYAGGNEGPVVTTLGSVRVSGIGGGQPGWLMRNKLFDRLSQGSETPAYRLDVTLDNNITSFGVRSDKAATQERISLRARFQLVDLHNNMVVLDDTAGSDASIDIVSSEYATLAAEQTSLENLSDVVADQIVARLALYADRARRAK